jgi:ABC-type sugar transport system permease subunit
VLKEEVFVSNIFLELLLWAFIGSIPGFYAYYMRQYDTRVGIGIGAFLGFVVGLAGTRLEFISSPLSAVVVIVGLLGVLMLLLPERQLSQAELTPSASATMTRKFIAVGGGILILLFLLIGVERAFFGYSVWVAVVVIVGGMIYAAFLARETDTHSATIQSTTLGMMIAVGVVALAFSIAIPTIAPLIIIFAGLIVYLFLIPPGQYTQSQSKTQRVTNLAYALLVPTVLIVLGIVIFPVLWNVIFSVRDIEISDLPTVSLFDVSDVTADNYIAQAGIRFDTVPCETEPGESNCLTDENGRVQYVNPRRYDGIDDYRGWREVGGINLGTERLAIGSRNEDFYPMLGRTLFYTLTSTILAITFGLIAALIVRDEFRGRTVFRGFILFPYIAPVISVAFVWQILFRQSGLVNGVFGTNIDYLGPSGYPLTMVILFQIWRYFPFAFLFLLARIQAIPSDIYEAAKVDGAVPSERLWYVTLPQLRAVFGTLFLLRFIWTFNKFDDIFSAHRADLPDEGHSNPDLSGTLQRE